MRQLQDCHERLYAEASPPVRLYWPVPRGTKTHPAKYSSSTGLTLPYEFICFSEYTRVNIHVQTIKKHFVSIQYITSSDKVTNDNTSLEYG